MLARPAAADVGVYADAIASGWQDWSWGGVTRSFAQSSPVHAGSAAIGVTYTDGWSGLQLGDPSAVDVSAYDSLRFWVHGGTAGGQGIQVSRRQQRHGALGVGDHHAERGDVDAGRRGARRPRITTPGRLHPMVQRDPGRAAGLLARRRRVRLGRPADADARAARYGSGARGRCRRRAPRDQPDDLRHELRRRRARGRAGAAGAALGRQRAPPATTGRTTPATTRRTGISRTSRTTIPTRRSCPTARPRTSSSIRTGGRGRRRC